MAIINPPITSIRPTVIAKALLLASKNRFAWQVSKDVPDTAVEGAVGIDGDSAEPLTILKFDKYPVGQPVSPEATALPMLQ